MALAKKSLPDPAKRNLEGMPKTQWRCIYHPTFCNNLGHKDTRSKECGMKSTSKAEKEAVKKSMLTDAVAEEMIKILRIVRTYIKKYLKYFSIILV